MALSARTGAEFLLSHVADRNTRRAARVPDQEADHECCRGQVEPEHDESAPSRHRSLPTSGWAAAGTWALGGAMAPGASCLATTAAAGIRVPTAVPPAPRPGLLTRRPGLAGGDEDRDDQADHGDDEHHGEGHGEGLALGQFDRDQDRADQGGAQEEPRLETLRDRPEISP